MNDYANAFHPATKEMIVTENEILYEETSNIDTIGGVQIVFATFLVKNVDEIAKYNKTDIFRQWKIGKNDMGVLVLMYFTEAEEDGKTFIYLEQTEFEVGYRMESYLPAGKQGRLLDETIYSDKYDDLDMKIAHLFYELLKIVYEDVYQEYYDAFTYDIDFFKQWMENYTVVEEDDPIGIFAWIIMLICGRSSMGWYYLIPTGIIVVVGGIFTGRNSGGGGSSGGYGIFRR